VKKADYPAQLNPRRLLGMDKNPVVHPFYILQGYSLALKSILIR
jgi:hypothetical protein